MNLPNQDTYMTLDMSINTLTFEDKFNILSRPGAVPDLFSTEADGGVFGKPGKLACTISIYCQV